MVQAGRWGIALLATGALVVAGCGDDEGDSGDSGATTTAVEAPAAQAPAEAAPFAIEVTDDGKKGTYTAPETAQAGLVEITLKNAGKATHEAQIVRVDGEQTAADVQKVVEDESGKIPAWMHGAGGPAPVEAGETGTVTAILEPGLHHIIDSGDTDAAAEPVSFTVEGEAAEAELPATDATVTARDFSFETEGLKPGKNTIRFENVGKELHHAIAFPMNEGADIDALKEAFMSEEEPEGPPPVDFERQVGTTVLDGGVAQNVELELDAGRYAFVCFITNRAGGPPHVALGMINEVDVAE